MFDFIRKSLLWEAWDDGLDREIGEVPSFQLKSMQDLAVYQHVREARNKQIAEIGAGHSRLLPTLAEANTCVSVEKFQGAGGGPTDEQEVPGVRNISAYLGERSSELAPDSFDIIFSISVVEHVGGQEALDAFHGDQLRILKPGGIFMHAIDIYLEDDPAPYHVRRFETYRGWVTSSPDIVPVGQVYEGPCKFTCDLATNPDNIMHSWGRVASSLIELRKVAQCASLLVAGRKLGPRPAADSETGSR